jgi:hypothetical protein
MLKKEVSKVFYELIEARQFAAIFYFILCFVLTLFFFLGGRCPRGQCLCCVKFHYVEKSEVRLEAIAKNALRATSDVSWKKN